MSLNSTRFRFMFGRGDKKRDAGLTSPVDSLRNDNITYGPHGKWNLLDVYRPRNIKGILPVIINVHGGGWVYGTKEVYQYYGMSLAQKGFAVVNFNYRLAPEHKYPASFEDLNKAIEWVFESAEAFEFDLDNMFLFGDSAGAHMVALYSCICTNPSYAALYDFDVPEGFIPKGIALNCGLYDLSKAIADNKMTGSLLKDFLGKKQVNENLELIEPLKYMTNKFPPAFVMTSTGDHLREEPKALVECFKSHDTPYVSKVYGDAVEQPPHVFHCNVRSEIANRCNDETCAYMKELLS